MKEVEERRAWLLPVPGLGSRADKGASGPHTHLGHGTAQRKPGTKNSIQTGWGGGGEERQRDRETDTQREAERDRETESQRTERKGLRKLRERNEGIDMNRDAETERLR